MCASSADVRRPFLDGLAPRFVEPCEVTPLHRHALIIPQHRLVLEQEIAIRNVSRLSGRGAPHPRQRRPPARPEGVPSPLPRVACASVSKLPRRRPALETHRARGRSSPRGPPRFGRHGPRSPLPGSARASRTARSHRSQRRWQQPAPLSESRSCANVVVFTTNEAGAGAAHRASRVGFQARPPQPSPALSDDLDLDVFAASVRRVHPVVPATRSSGACSLQLVAPPSTCASDRQPRAAPSRSSPSCDFWTRLRWLAASSSWPRRRSRSRRRPSC